MSESEVDISRSPSVDPEEVLTALSRVLEDTGLEPPIRYALSVVLLAQEVRNTVEGPFPDRLRGLISETLEELRLLRDSTPHPAPTVSGANILRLPAR